MYLVLLLNLGKSLSLTANDPRVNTAIDGDLLTELGLLVLDRLAQMGLARLDLFAQTADHNAIGLALLAKVQSHVEFLREALGLDAVAAAQGRDQLGEVHALAQLGREVRALEVF